MTGAPGAARTHGVIGGLISTFRQAYPGISREAATQCLLAMADVRSERRLSGTEALDLFHEQVYGAERRGEAWAVEVRRSINQTRETCRDEAHRP